MPVFTIGEVLTAALVNQIQGTPTAKSGNYTAVDGDIVEMSGAHTVTLPAPSTSQQTIGIQSVNGSGTAPCTITTPTGAIVGKGVAAAATSILLGAPGAYVVLHSDGTNWNIESGEQDTGWVAFAYNSGFATSNSYPIQWRLMGNRVELRGQFVTSSGFNNNAIVSSMGACPLPTISTAGYGINIRSGSNGPGLLNFTGSKIGISFLADTTFIFNLDNVGWRVD